MTITAVGLDGDDTLWHSEGHFHVTEQRFRELMAPWTDPDDLSAALVETERRNLRLFGYGVKGFTLSMIETALTLTGHRIDGRHIETIIGFGKELLAHPVELLDGVADTVAALADHYRLVLVTKGDLFHQESKVAASRLGELFERVEVVAEKDVPTYGRVLGRMGIAPPQFCMIGNSVRSDVIPVLDLGGYGIHIPYHVTWALERAEMPGDRPGWTQVGSIAEAPAALARLGGA